MTHADELDLTKGIKKRNIYTNRLINFTFGGYM